MRYVAQGLARAGHTVHVPQLAGHCGSAEELKATTWQHWYETVEIEHRLLRETVRHGGCRRSVDGGDLGASPRGPASARCVCAWPSTHPPCGSMAGAFPGTATSSSSSPRSGSRTCFRSPRGIRGASRIRASGRFVEQAISSGDSSRAGIAALPGSLMLELRWLVKQVKREVGQVHQPTLIVHPREDDRASLRNLEYLQTNLGGLIETVVLDDSYHIVTLDRQRQLVVDRTLEFISHVLMNAIPTCGIEDNLEWLLAPRTGSNG